MYSCKNYADCITFVRFLGVDNSPKGRQEKLVKSNFPVKTSLMLFCNWQTW